MAENWNIGLGLELKSDALTSVQKQIDSIGNSVKPIKLNVDVSQVQKQLNSIKSQIQGISKIKIDLGGTTSSGGSKTVAAAKELQSLKKEITEFTAMQKKIGNLKLKISGLENLGGNTKQITVLKQQLEELESVYDSTFHTFQKQIRASDLTTQDFSKLNTAVTDVDYKLKALSAQYEDTRAKMAKSIQSDITNGTLGVQIDDLKTKFQKLGLTEEQAAEKTQLLQTLMDRMKGNDDVKSVIQDYDTFKTTLTSVTNEYRNMQNAASLSSADTKLDQQKAALLRQIDLWLTQNSAATKQFGAELDNLKAKIKNADATSFSGLKGEFQDIVVKANQAGVATQSFGDKLKSQFEKLSVYFSASMMISKAIQGLRSMYNNVLAVDTAMTELYRVTDLTTSQYEELYAKMTKSAKDYAMALDTIIASTASWVRLGFDANTANQLAEITAMYQHVTDLDEKTAVNNLVTAYKGFQDQLLELGNGSEAQAIERIADIYDKLGNEFALSAADVGEGLSKSASVLQQGGASIQEAAGMFTGIQEVLQDAGTSGAALKILTLRIRGMKGELEELGEEVDDNIDSVSKIQTQILNLTHGKVNIFDDNKNFRDIYDIMKDISEVYDTLSDPDRASLLELIAGKNRANAVQALISNWEQVEKATKAAYEAEGTAAAENEKYLESMQGRLDSLKASWQALSNSFLNSDLLKTGITLVNDFVDLLDFSIDKLGALPTLLTAISAGLSFKNIGRYKMFYLIKVNMPILTIVLFRYKQFRCYKQ